MEQETPEGCGLGGGETVAPPLHLAPQSEQSVPKAQPLYWEPGPPSSQIPSLLQDEVHVSRQVQLVGGGGEGEGGPFHGAGGGGAPTSKLLVTVHG